MAFMILSGVGGLQLVSIYSEVAHRIGFSDHDYYLPLFLVRFHT